MEKEIAGQIQRFEIRETQRETGTQEKDRDTKKKIVMVVSQVLMLYFT